MDSQQLLYRNRRRDRFDYHGYHDFDDRGGCNYRSRPPKIHWPC
jgi:hypothetical protein